MDLFRFMSAKPEISKLVSALCFHKTFFSFSFASLIHDCVAIVPNFLSYKDKNINTWCLDFKCELMRMIRISRIDFNIWDNFVFNCATFV